MESKICPFSMGGEPTECCEEECQAWIDGECAITKIAMSMFFIAKNSRRQADELERIRGGR